MASRDVAYETIPTDELLKLENQLCFPLYACSKEVVRRYTPHLDILDSGTLTPMLKKMEDKGYVSRVRSSVDERRVNVRLTEAGEKLKEEAREVPMAMGQCVNIDPDDAAKLVHLLRKVLANVRES